MVTVVTLAVTAMDAVMVGRIVAMMMMAVSAVAMMMMAVSAIAMMMVDSVAATMMVVNAAIMMVVRVAAATMMMVDVVVMTLDAAVMMKIVETMEGKVVIALLVALPLHTFTLLVKSARSMVTLQAIVGGAMRITLTVMMMMMM
jgi:hypothetical protein